MAKCQSVGISEGARQRRVIGIYGGPAVEQCEVGDDDIRIFRREVEIRWFELIKPVDSPDKDRAVVETDTGIGHEEIVLEP